MSPSAPPLSVSDLPLELILTVFYWCTLASPDAPLTISSVCRRWLQLTRSSPELWTRLDLHIHSLPDNPDPAQGKHSLTHAVRKASAWFDRSGIASLDVQITIRNPAARPCRRSPSPSPSSPVTIPSDSPLASLFQTHIHRIRTLVVHAPSEAGIQPLIRPFHFPEPAAADDSPRSSLLELELEATDDSPPAHPPLTDSAVATLPFVTPKSISVHLTNLAVPSTWLNLESLASLTVTHPILAPPLSLTHIFALLEKSPALQYFSLHSRIFEAPAASSLSPIRTLSLPHLHSLHLTLNNTIDVLLALRTPNLSTLSITDLDGRAPWTGRALKAFLTSRPPLKHVKFERLLGIEHGTWEWCLTRLPLLEGASLAYCERGEYIVAALARRPGDKSEPQAFARARAEPTELCPGLRHLSLVQCPGVYDSILPWFRTIRPQLRMDVVNCSDAEDEEGGWEGWDGLASRGWGVHLR